MDCNPPWLSPTNQCSINITTYKNTSAEIANMIYSKIVKPKKYWKLIEMEEKCKNPCKKMTNIVSIKVDEKKRYNGGSMLEFRFKKTVRVEKKVVVYTWFDFIIDVGSSLGLWLGLSALSIIEQAIEALMVANKCLK